MEPDLTTVRQPMGEMGRTAANLLLDAIRDNEPSEASVEIPTELIVRGSTGPVRS
ncbi:MAG: substrate-binding domain-containing protein [Acidimicrobiia bacterium]